MRKTILVVMLLLGTVSPSYAQLPGGGVVPVIDAAAIAKLVSQIGILTNQLRVLRDQYQDMLRNSANANPSWNTHTAQLLRLLGELGEATSVLYTHDGSQKVWGETYTEDETWEDGTWLAHERARNHATIRTQRDLLQLIETRRRTMEDDVARIEALQEEASSTTGRNQMLKVGLAFQGEQAWRLAQLEELISVMANAQIIAAVEPANERTAREAQERAFMRNYDRRPQLYPWRDEGLR